MEPIALDPHYEYPGGALKKRPRDPEVDRLLDELRAWCSEKYGRQTELARHLKIDNRRVHDWLSGRLTPSLAMGIKLQEFLKKHRRRK
jgi:hypothetical protein